MKVVLEQYAVAILAATIAMLLFGVVLHLPKEGNVFLWQAPTQLKRGEAFDRSMDGKALNIVFMDAYALKEGQPIENASILVGVTETGVELPVTIQKVYDEDFREVSARVSTEDGIVCIDAKGIYWILVEAKETDNNPTKSVVKLFVN